MGTVFRMLLVVLASLAVHSPAWADSGGDHAHDDGAGSAAVTIAPRAEARIGDKQLVLIYANRRKFEDQTFGLFGGTQPVKLSDSRIVVFLESFIDASPVSGATLEAVINFLPEPLTEEAPGVYISNSVTLGGGSNEIELNYRIGEESGVLPLVLIVPGGASSGTAAVSIDAPPPKMPGWLIAGVGLAVYLLIFALFFISRRSANSAGGRLTGSPRS